VLVLEYSFFPEALRDFGSSEFAKQILRTTWGTPPWLEIDFAVNLQRFLIEAANSGWFRSCCDIGSGGLVTALARAGFQNRIGVDVNTVRMQKFPESFSLFAEAPAVIVSCDPASVEAICERASGYGLNWARIGKTTENVFRFSTGPVDESRGPLLIDTTVDELHRAWSTALESQLTEEVSA
jgi:phosphoribosylformylglycinamidine (FGAM) synthase-like enzyme